MTRKPTVILPVVVVALVLALYVLSVGPAAQWVVTHEAWLHTVSALYLPLDWLTAHSDVANRILSQYVQWWLKL